MVAPESIFDEVFLVPVDVRRAAFERSLQQSWPDDDFLDVFIEMTTDGPLSARHVGRWLHALNVGFGKFARLQGIADPELLIVEIGTGSFWTRLRKVNDVIALPGFLLGIYALVAAGKPVDEATLRRVLSEQKPAATATCDLFLKDQVTEIRFSVGKRALGKLTIEDARQFRSRSYQLSRQPDREDEPLPPELPTWEAVLERRPQFESERLMLEDMEDIQQLSPPRPTFRDGTVMGTFLQIDGDPYVRLEGMEGVLVPVRAKADLTTGLVDRGAYRFIGHYHARHDGVRTSFQIENALPVGTSS